MQICFIGGGNMATALIGGLLNRDFKPSQLRVVEIITENRIRLEQEFGISTTEDLSAGVEGSEVIVIAVKPQQLRGVALLLSPLLTGQLIISIAAGIRTVELANWLETQSVVRAMPNTPALIGCGMTGLYALPDVNEAQCAQAQNILAAAGKTLWVTDEAMLDAVTAISGSGPAYVFYFIEAMQQAARDLGFDDTDARLLTVETFLGASRLVDSSADDAGVLRSRVTSKNGTTERALHYMDEHKLKSHIIEAAMAAACRSRELGDEWGKIS